MPIILFAFCWVIIIEIKYRKVHAKEEVLFYKKNSLI